MLHPNPDEDDAKRIETFDSNQFRNRFREWLKDHMIDTFRHLHPYKPACYTRWNPLRKELGLGSRLDYLLVSPKLARFISQHEILSDEIGSDHAPIRLNLFDELDDRPLLSANAFLQIAKEETKKVRDVDPELTLFLEPYFLKLSPNPPRERFQKQIL
jgi:hypothetical protein